MAMPPSIGAVSTPPLARDVAAEVTVPFPRAEELYDQYGGECDGIDRDEFEAMLRNLDGFSDVLDGPVANDEAARRVQQYVDAEFERADLNHDGVIDLDEFTLYYFTDICFKFPVGKDGFNPGATLYNIFCNYCSFGKGGRRCEEMESHQLLKLCKQCGLLQRTRCRKADVDLVFHRARSHKICARVRGAAKLQYNDFLRALMLIADKHHAGFCEVVSKIQRYGINRRDPSMADFLVFRDPGGLYEDARDLERPPGLPRLHRPLPPATSLTSHGGIGAGADAWGAVVPQGSQSLAAFPSAGAALHAAAGCGDHAQPAARQQRWSAAASDALMIGGTGSVQGSSLESCTPAALQDTAGRRANDVMASTSMRRQWDFTQTSRSFYDDADNQRLAEVQQEPALASLLQPREPSGRSHSPAAAGGRLDRAAVFRDSLAMHKVREAPEEKLTMALKYVFELFNCCDGGVNRSRMNKIRFQKVLRDARLLSERDLTSGEADRVFQLVKPQSQDAANFVQFMEALRHCATVKRVSLNEVVHRIVALGGPVEASHR